MKSLYELAAEYADKNFPMSRNEAMRILMQIGGQPEPDKRISPFDFIEIE